MPTPVNRLGSLFYLSYGRPPGLSIKMGMRSSRVLLVWVNRLGSLFYLLGFAISASFTRLSRRALRHGVYAVDS